MQSYVWGGRIYNGSAYASATYKFNDKLNVSGSVSYRHTSVRSNISRHYNGVTGSLWLKWYLKDFSLSPYVNFYSRSLSSMSLSYSSVPMTYGLQATYSHKNLYVALNCVTPFDRLRTKSWLTTPLYENHVTSYSRSGSRYVSLTLSFSFDFGKRVERVEREKSSVNSSLMTL